VKEERNRREKRRGKNAVGGVDRVLATSCGPRVKGLKVRAFGKERAFWQGRKNGSPRIVFMLTRGKGTEAKRERESRGRSWGKLGKVGGATF